jgi:hypothetical protein
MAGGGEMSAAELAERTGLQERWLPAGSDSMASRAEPRWLLSSVG